MNYTSSYWVESNISPEVGYRIRRISFGTRLALMAELRSLTRKGEWAEAASVTEQQTPEAGLLTGEIQKLYLEAGLLEISGLTIDGEPASTDRFVELGPEDLVGEALTWVCREFGLSEEEKKNC